MNASTDQLVQQIHDSQLRIVLAAAGGGSRAIAELLDVPGGSRTLFEAVVPYSAAAMRAFLGFMPEEFCSSATARAMALAAFFRGRSYDTDSALMFRRASSAGRGATANLSSNAENTVGQASRGAPQSTLDGAPVAGVACSAALASDRPKHGAHRIHLALQTASLTASWHLQLNKGRRSRAEEERLAGRMILNIIAEAGGLAMRLELGLLEGERVESARVVAPPAWQELMLGGGKMVRIGPDIAQPRLVMPGAFNPWHVGHQRMIELAESLVGSPAALELSIANVDKPPLDYIEIERRLGQFPATRTVFLTRAATFEEKSRLTAGATFVVGADTLLRIADPRYYDGDATARDLAVARIADRGCRFLVFARLLGERFMRLDDLDLPQALRAICREVPPEMFREDVSSTELRKSATR
jgi:nicotinic acid mononucleotide adenylyltransferase